jgi:Mg-chelatase subunit ChlD
MKTKLTFLLLTTAQWAFATGLQPVGTSAPVRVQAVDFNLEMRGLYVSSVMEVQFFADSGEENAANLRFPLPPDSVLHKAEIYLPEFEQWTQAETMGRREGEIIYNEIVEQQLDPLLIQRIGTDFYRARVYPINEQGDLRMRVYYAHTLETADNHYRLRVPFANKDATAATPANGITISLQTDANYWTAGAWQMGDEMGTPSTLNDEMGTPSTVNLDNGTTLISLEDFSMSKDITLDLTPNEPMSQATARYYQPEAPNLVGHLHTWWQPDFSDYPAVTSQPRNVVFVIDVSGSMSGAKIAQTRQAVINSLEALSDEDYFGIVAFDDQVYVFRPNMRSGADIQAAIEWVSNLIAMGSTGMSAGLTTGAAIGIRSPLVGASIDLLLVTDGRPNVGSSTVDGILADVSAEAEQLGRKIRIFSVGIGHNLDQALLNGLAQQRDGESTFALDDNEITGQILDLFARVRGGGVSDVIAAVQTASVSDNQFTWRRIFSGTALQMGAKGDVANSMHLNLDGRLSDLTSITLNTTLAPLSSNSTIDRIAAPLAAKTWADQLERQIDAEGETAELVNQAVNLARTYGIVTRYSSLLALQNEELYEKQGINRIARDPAGIALQPVELSTVDESQIGGQGTDDGDSESFGAPPPPGRTYLPQPMVAADMSNSAFFVSPSPAPTNAVGTPYSGGPVSAGASGGTSSGVGASGSAPMAYYDSPPASMFCENPLLDEQLRLDIPRLNYQGYYLWGSLQLVVLPDGTLRLDVLNYGPVAPPNHNSACQLEEIVLSATMQLHIPLVLYQTATEEVPITDIILQGKMTADGRLKFEVIDYQF